MKEARVSGYFAGCSNEQCQTEVLDFKIWDAENVLCLLSGLLPGSHQPIKFISIGQVWNTDTMPDRESRSQLPRNCLSRSQDSPSRASAPLFMYETHHNESLGPDPCIIFKGTFCWDVWNTVWWKNILELHRMY